jgi:hypothetical protein
MLRKFGCALFVLVVCAGVSLADEVKGKVKSVDPVKNTIMVTDKDDKDHTFTLTDKTDVLDAGGKAIEGGLKAAAFKKIGMSVTITFEKKGDKEVASKVQLES